MRIWSFAYGKFPVSVSLEAFVRMNGNHSFRKEQTRKSTRGLSSLSNTKCVRRPEQHARGSGVLTNLMPGDLQLNENEHLHFSKFVGSPFLCATGLCHDGTGPVSMPTAEPTGSVATGNGLLDGACTESTRIVCGGRCGRKPADGLCCNWTGGGGGGGGLPYGLSTYVSDTWTGCWTNGSRSGT